MTFNLTEPNPGDKISANLIREIIRSIRSLTPIKGPGMKISRGPNGTTYCADVSKTVKPQQILPWTFRCSVNNKGESNETRTGGWMNGQLQFGLDAHWFGDYVVDRTTSGVAHRITGCDQTEDGSYYIEIKANSGTAELKRFAADASAPSNDFENDTYYIYIGTVEDARQTDGIYCVPVFYKFI